jgi:hypothetical protein
MVIEYGRGASSKLKFDKNLRLLTWVIEYGRGASSNAIVANFNDKSFKNRKCNETFGNITECRSGMSLMQFEEGDKHFHIGRNHSLG